LISACQLYTGLKAKCFEQASSSITLPNDISVSVLPTAVNEASDDDVKFETLLPVKFMITKHLFKIDIFN